MERRGSKKLNDEDYKKILKERFLNKIIKKDKCWFWSGYIAKHGYGVTTYRSKTILVHRLSWILFRGELIIDMDICHHCDNPLCVNPDHLFIGTTQDNVRDCFNKKRKCHIGEKHPGAKLNENDVLEIFKLRKIGWTHQKLADRFKIKQGTVSNILHRRLWKHVNV